MTIWKATSTYSKNYELILEAAEKSYSVVNNSSVVSWKLSIKTSNGTYYEDWQTKAYAVINGKTEAYVNGLYSTPYNGTKVIGSGEVTVNHESNGKKSIKCSAIFQTSTNASYLPGSITIEEQTLTLTNIPRNSTFGTISGNTIGSGISININRAAGTSYKHKLYYSFGALTNQSITDEAGTSIAFTPPLALCSQIPNATSGTMTIYMETYSDSTKIGNTVSKTLSLNVPENVVPTIGSLAVADTVEQCLSLGFFVQMKSKLKIDILNVTEAYNATIKSCLIEVTGEPNIYEQSGTTAELKSSGTLTIKGTVIDTRGRSATIIRNDIVVTPYHSPKLSDYSAVRVQSDAETTDEVSTKVSGSVASLKSGNTEKNSLLYKIKYRKISESVYKTTTVPTTGITISEFLHSLTGIDKTSSYFFVFSISDYFGEEVCSPEVAVGTGDVIMHRCKDGVGIKKYRENGALDVKGDIYANNKLVSVEGHAHTAVKDAGDGANTTFAFSKDALTTASWLTVWNNYELRKISPANLKTVLGTPLSHTHAIADITSLQTTLNAKSPLARTVTSLWTGSVQSGTVTVNTALTNFRYLYVTVGTSSSTYATYIIVPLPSSPTQFRGIGGYESPSNGVEIYSLRGTISGTSITLDEVYVRNANALATNNGGTRLYMKGIYGVR